MKLNIKSKEEVVEKKAMAKKSEPKVEVKKEEPKNEAIWIPVFESLDDFDKHMIKEMGVYHHWYNKPMKCWYTNRFAMREGSVPTVESWYQDYLKSRAV